MLHVYLVYSNKRCRITAAFRIKSTQALPPDKRCAPNAALTVFEEYCKIEIKKNAKKLP